MNPAQQCELAMAIADSPPSVQEEIARLRDELAARNALIQGLEQTGERLQRAGWPTSGPVIERLQT